MSASRCWWYETGSKTGRSIKPNVLRVMMENQKSRSWKTPILIWWWFWIQNNWIFSCLSFDFDKHEVDTVLEFYDRFFFFFFLFYLTVFWEANEFRILFLYEFKLGQSAVEAHRWEDRSKIQVWKWEIESPMTGVWAGKIGKVCLSYRAVETVEVHFWAEL